MTDRHSLAVCRNVSLGHDERAVLEHVTFAVESGEILAILGRSGSGKSTLLKTLAGLLPPLSGTTELFGQDLYALERSERHELLRRMGMLFQSDALFGSLTVLENVMFPLVELTDLPERLVREIALSKLQLLGIADLAERLPSAVSGGQRKRAGLARAIVLDPELLLCDEPTSGLDPITAAHLDETLIEMREVLAVAIVTVTHDADSVGAIADRALVLGEGHVAFEGRVEDLKRSDEPEVYFFFHRGRPRSSAPQPTAR